MNLIALEGFCGGGFSELEFPATLFPRSWAWGGGEGRGGGSEAKCQASEFQYILDFRLENTHLQVCFQFR